MLPTGELARQASSIDRNRSLVANPVLRWFSLPYLPGMMTTGAVNPCEIGTPHAGV